MGYVSLEIDQLHGRSWSVCVKFGFIVILLPFTNGITKQNGMITLGLFVLRN
jgi:hypothetical protein